MEKLLDAVFYTFYAGLCLLLPKRRRIAFFSFPDAADNAFYLYREFVKRGCGDEMVWLVNDVSEAIQQRLASVQGAPSARLRVVKRLSVRGLLLFCSSRTAFCTHGTYRFVRRAHRAPAIVNLWHGMPIKKIGLLNPADATVAFCDYSVSLSHYYVAILAKSFGIAEDHVLPCGTPRTDVLLSADATAAGRLCAEKLGCEAGQRVIMWMPTFRQAQAHGKLVFSDASTSSFLSELPDGFLARLDALAVQNRCLVIVKIHPLDPLNDASDLPAYRNVRFVTARHWAQLELDLYAFLAGCAALVSDLSSVILDALYAGKRVGVFNPAPSAYGRPMYFDPLRALDVVPLSMPEDFMSLLDPVDASQPAVDRDTVLAQPYVVGCASFLQEKFLVR